MFQLLLSLAGFTYKHIFTAAVDSVVERAFREKGSTYSQMSLFDTELREVTPPPSLEWPTKNDIAARLGGADPTKALQIFVTKAAFETGIFFAFGYRIYASDWTIIALVHIHRWFFIQAIWEMPENPFDHPFGHSVKTILGSSHTFIEALHDTYQHQPTGTACFRPFWTHAFSAAVN